MRDFDTTITELDTCTRSFLDELAAQNFNGDILTGYDDRIVNATDNSIYQIVPQAILAPKDGAALSQILKLSAKAEYRSIKLMPRGGGTGTNGQALNDCVILDTSKYLTRILEINASQQTVKVEPGVVLDRLNAALKSHHLSFPVHISPSKSATIGGMVSTDACGKGSSVYGKTGDYILDMTCILPDGREISTANHDNVELGNIIAEHYEEIAQNAPTLPRGLSAYDLLRAHCPNKQSLNMTRLITGSEGSLAVIKDITLRLIKPKTKRIMIAAFYDDFIGALEDVSRIMTHSPVAVETIDDKIISLARGDILWHQFKDILPDERQAETIRAAHFIEFEDDDEAVLKDKAQAFQNMRKDIPHFLSFSFIHDEAAIQNVHAVRSKCVGLLGNTYGLKRPIPFIEDTAVPPQNLATYIADLKTLLDNYDLSYGMFGHSDAGCMHVRPALNIQDAGDQSMIRTLSDAISTIVKKHGGVIWGEHGKGLRAEYTADLVGSAYAKTMSAVKTYLDPYNKLNPGKITAPEGYSLHAIDRVPMRGDYDRQVKKETQARFPKAMQCNGNGQCFSAMPDDTMCPSYKVTGNRKHSPKGRAALLREWMRLKDTNKRAANKFAPKVFDALNGCLSCKACTSTCPIHVNIPNMKADFLADYHKRHSRHLRDYIIGWAEKFASIAHYLPPIRPSIEGLIDIPHSHYRGFKKSLHEHNIQFATAKTIKDASNPVVIIQDAYTTYYETPVFLDILLCLQKLGYTPLIVPFFESGKSWHVRGFVKKFRRIALNNIAKLENLNRHGAPIIGIDPSMSLVYRDEYAKFLAKKPRYKVYLLQEWLAQNMKDRDDLPPLKTIPKTRYNLFLHCTEKTMRPQSYDEWSAVFGKFGIALTAMQTGCCGMAGVYGHEKEHFQNSKDLFDLSWSDQIDETALVSGYSCRTQTKRFKNYEVKHPLVLLKELL